MTEVCADLATTLELWPIIESSLVSESTIVALRGKNRQIVIKHTKDEQRDRCSFDRLSNTRKLVRRGNFHARYFLVSHKRCKLVLSPSCNFQR